MAKLTPKEIRFIQFYEGNATQAMRDAGYKGSANVLGVTANRLLRKPKIVKAIEERTERKNAPKIATREERQRFWSEVMESDTVDMKDRLKASELLGRSQADFIDKIQHSGTIDLNAVIEESRKVRGLKP